MKAKAYYSILFLVLMFGLLLHSQFSFCQSDESFYLSTTYRLLQGDQLIIDEWHPTQFYSPLLLPFYKVFYSLTLSNQGIILYFRILTIIFSVFVCWLFFIEAQRIYNTYFSFCAAVILLLFTRANIEGPSYYKLSTTLVTLAFTLHLKSGRIPKPADFFMRGLVGITISFAVLCQPFLAFFVIIAGIVGIAKKSSRHKTLQICSGILIAAIWYIIVFLPKVTINEYINGLQYVLSDPQHQNSFFSWLYVLIKGHFSTNSIVVICLTLYLTIYVILKYINNKNITRYFYVLQCFTLILSFIKPLIKIHYVPCYSYLGTFVVASFPFMLNQSLRNKISQASIFYCVGIVLAISFSLGSNTGYDAMLTGYCISAAAMVLEISRSPILFTEKTKHKDKVDFGNIVAKKITIVLCAFILLIMGIQKTFGFYRDAPIQLMNKRITEGPAAGLITTEQHAKEYNSIYNIINNNSSCLTNNNAKLICSKLVPWAFLCSPLRCGAPSTWTAEISSPRLVDYFNSHDSYAMYVVIFAENVGSYDSNFFNNHLERNNMNSQILEGEFHERIQNNSLIVYNDSQLTIYLLEKGNFEAGSVNSHLLLHNSCVTSVLGMVTSPFLPLPVCFC